MDAGGAELHVVDEEDEDRFVVEVDGMLAVLEYAVAGERLVLVHTEVPEPLEGRGIGGMLVRAALDRAERDGSVVVPNCPFARGWLRSHRDEAARVTIEWPRLKRIN